MRVWLIKLLYTHRGLLEYAPDWMPRARVRYPCGGVSIAMPLGNAYEYAEMFGGEVLRV